MSNIILQNSLPLINTTNFINDFLDTLLEEYCSQHYKENTILDNGISLPTLSSLIHYKYPNYKLISPGVLGHIYTTEVKVIYEEKDHNLLLNALEHKLNIIFTQYIPKNFKEISFSMFSINIGSLKKILNYYSKQLNATNLIKNYTSKSNIKLKYEENELDIFLKLSKIVFPVIIYKPTVETLNEIKNRFLKGNEKTFNELDFNSFDFKVFIISLYITTSSEKELKDIKDNISSDYFYILFNKCSEYLFQFKIEINEYINVNFNEITVEYIEKEVNYMYNRSKDILEEVYKENKIVREYLENCTENESKLNKDNFYCYLLIGVIIFSCILIFK